MNIQPHAHYPKSTWGNTFYPSTARPNSPPCRGYLPLPRSSLLQDILRTDAPSTGTPSLPPLPSGHHPLQGSLLLRHPPLFPSTYIQAENTSHPIRSLPIPSIPIPFYALLSYLMPSHPAFTPVTPSPAPPPPGSQSIPLCPSPSYPIPSRVHPSWPLNVIQSASPPTSRPASEPGSHTNHPSASHRQTSSSPELTL